MDSFTLKLILTATLVGTASLAERRWRPALGGWLSGNSLDRPLLLAAALSLVAVVFVYLLLPESLPALTSRWTTIEQGLTMGLSNSAMSLGASPAPGGRLRL